MFASEKKFAKLLTRQNKEWQYSPSNFQIGKTTYRPDFYLPQEDMYIELVATRTSFRQRIKTLKLMKKYHPEINIVIMNLEGKQYLSSNFLFSLPNEYIPNKYTMIRLPIEAWKRLKELAKKEKRTMGNTISILLDKIK